MSKEEGYGADANHNMNKIPASAVMVCLPWGKPPANGGGEHEWMENLELTGKPCGLFGIFLLINVYVWENFEMSFLFNLVISL